MLDDDFATSSASTSLVERYRNGIAQQIEEILGEYLVSTSDVAETGTEHATFGASTGMCVWCRSTRHGFRSVTPLGVTQPSICSAGIYMSDLYPPDCVSGWPMNSGIESP